MVRKNFYTWLANLSGNQTPPPHPSNTESLETSPSHHPSLAKGAQNFLDLLEVHRVPSDIRALFKVKMTLSKAERIDEALEEIVSFKPIITLQSSGPIILGGSPGVGKSICSAKLACEALIMGKPVELLTTDVLKAGAVQQTKVYADALGIPMESFDSAAKLHGYIQSRDPKTLFIIDTAGVNPFQREDFNSLVEIVLTLRKLPILVFPANLDAYEAIDHLEAFKALGARQLLITRGDMTKRWGAVLSCLALSDISLAALNMGPELGNRLENATAKILADLCLRVAISSSNDLSQGPNLRLVKT